MLRLQSATYTEFLWEVVWFNSGSLGKNCTTAAKSPAKPGKRKMSMHINILVRTLQAPCYYEEKVFLKVRCIAFGNGIYGDKISEQAFKRGMVVTRGRKLCMKTTLVCSMFLFRD